MHGLIFQELKEYIRKKLGLQAWDDVRKDAGVETTLFTSVQVYPDSDMQNLVTSIATHLGQTRPAMLEEFGRYFISGFLKTRAYLFDPSWDYLTIIEHGESFVQKVEARQRPGQMAAVVHGTRTGPNEVTLTYYSKRKLCPFVRGILKGLALHYGVEVTIEEPRCMHKGQSECEFVIRVVGDDKKKEARGEQSAVQK